jgi:hypothetical protein
MLQVRDQMAQLAAENGLKVSPGITAGLLPTPNTMNHLPARSAEKIAESKLRTPGGYANVRETVVNDLLPTPVASEGTKQDTTVTVQERIDTGHQVHLTHIARSGVDEPQVWGKFAPAIARWEQILGRPAPAPTKPDGKDGAHRLSSAFTEWMMGLPEGWITDCGLTRNEELKACGNGVVPQQARLALRILLDGIAGGGWERERETMLPTPTVMDQQSMPLRTVAIQNLKRGKNRGIGLNNLVETIGLDWNDGDTFDVVNGKVTKNEQKQG